MLFSPVPGITGVLYQMMRQYRLRGGWKMNQHMCQTLWPGSPKIGMLRRMGPGRFLSYQTLGVRWGVGCGRDLKRGTLLIRGLGYHRGYPTLIIR
jgi:hypothetical protein